MKTFNQAFGLCGITATLPMAMAMAIAIWSSATLGEQRKAASNQGSVPKQVYPMQQQRTKPAKGTKGTQMKTNKTVSKIMFGMGAALALAMAVSLLTTARAEGPMKPMKGSEMFMMKPITSSQDVAGLKDGDMVAMACPKCKTITITYINTEKGHIKTTTPGQEHLCPGCGQKFVIVGEGKGKHDVVTHVCKKCGSTNAFCCVLKKDSEPTPGIERK